jgi:hypothetical protein
MIVSLARIERWVWYIFLATAAWQTRLIVWQADALFIEWRSASVYVSDVLMLALFAGWASVAHKRSEAPLRAEGWLLGLLFASAVISLSSAEHLTVGMYGLARLAQFITFYFYLRWYAWRRFDADMSGLAFVIGAVGQALLGIAQYMLQHDLGLRWVGETLLRTDMRGVAVFYDLAYEKVLRAYGTLPHPNVLAAYLMVALWVVVWLWVRHGGLSRRSSMVWHMVTSILLVGMYLTFSRTVIAVWLLAWVLLCIGLWWGRISGRWPNIAELRRRVVPVLVTIGVLSVGFSALLWPQVVARLTISVSDEAVQQRVRYNADALASGGGWTPNVNWTGVGIGNFTTWLGRYDRALPSFVTQPAHNVYLLVYSEIGMVGLAILLAWLGSVLVAVHRGYREEPFIRTAVFALACTALLVGTLDHFFWTLQQGRILWWALLALAAGKA